MDVRQEEMEIDLRELWQILKKRVILIITIVLIALITSVIISYWLLTPIYEASTEILVNKKENNQIAYNINDISADLKLIQTYSVIITSPRIINLVIAENNLPYTVEQLTKKININTVKDSQVMKITVQDESQANAAFIANAVVNVFQREIVKIMKVDNVQILTEAVVLANPVPVKPKPILNIVIAVFLGIMLGASLAFFLEYLDTSIKTEDEVERLLSIPVLGAIGIIPAENAQKKRDNMHNQQKMQKRGEKLEF